MHCLIVTGGSGYLGQFLVHALSPKYRILYTYSSRKLPDVDNVHAVKVDLATGEGIEELFGHDHASDVVAVINCAAISSPAACEGENQSMARSLNVPSVLLSHLRKLQTSPLLIHLSTDQVYDGSKAMWTEEDDVVPVNAYGRTKAEAEQEIRSLYQHHVILRSSIIYGPSPPLLGLPSERFLQFIERSLRGSSRVTFFHDEWRSVIFVDDIVQIISQLVEKACQKETDIGGMTFNMGGPERLSRLEFALTVAEARGLSKDLIVSASCLDISRPIRSPQDISMNVGKIEEALGIRFTTLRDALLRI